MTPTQEERINATARVEYFYRVDHPKPTKPKARWTHVNQEGYSAWLGAYEDLREDGQDHETAIRAVEHGLRVATGLEPPDPPPDPQPPPVVHLLVGVTSLERHCLTDDNGSYLGAGFSFFWASRAFKDHRDRYDANMAWGAKHGFNYYRGLVLTGGWPNPDPWRDAGAFLPWALEILPQVLDDAFTRYGLRCSLTLFDGFPQTPTIASQRTFVRAVCDILKPRLQTINDVQIANEYGPCGWDSPEGIGWLREHARTVRQLLGAKVPLALSSRNASMNDADYDTAIREAQALYGGGLLDVVNLAVDHDSRETGMIDGEWRHVRQGWERVLHDRNGTPLTPDNSLDDEPMGPRSSVAEETSVSRLVQKAVVDYVSGRCAYTFHPDSGIWSNLLNPPQRGMGEFRLIEDHPSSTPFAEAFNRIRAVLPADLPSWNRTRHGLPGHPFGTSFQPSGDVFTQIWPDRVTPHGVVRAYCATRSDAFVCPLTGIKDRITLRWDRALEAKIYSCRTGNEIAPLLSGAERERTLPQSLDTDLVVVGRLT